MKMRENKVACHIGQVSCMNLEFSLARKLFHLSRAIGQAERCTTVSTIKSPVSTRNTPRTMKPAYIPNGVDVRLH